MKVIRRAMVSLFILTLFFSLVIPTAVQAQEKEQMVQDIQEQAEKKDEKKIGAGAELDFVSRYMWRGIALSESGVMNPSAWVSGYGFTLLGWANYVLGEEPYWGEFNEFDIYASYEFEKDAFSATATYQHYFYTDPEYAPDTGEVAVKLAYAVKDFNVFTVQTVDVEEYPGAYFGEFGVGYEKGFDDDKALFEANFKFGIGSDKFNKAYIGPDITAFNMVGGEAALTYSFNDHFYVKPHFCWTSLTDQELRDAVTDPDLVSGGLILGVEF